MDSKIGVNAIPVVVPMLSLGLSAIETAVYLIFFTNGLL